MVESDRNKVVQIVQMVVSNHQNDVLLLERANTGFLDGWLTLPGGHVEKDEPILEAAIRECREETTLQVIEAHVGLVMPYKGGVDYVVVANSWSGTPTIGEPDTCSRLEWFPRDDLPERATRVVRTALKLLSQGVWFHQYVE